MPSKPPVHSNEYSSYDEAYRLMRTKEGGYRSIITANNPKIGDLGGETFNGIAYKFNDDKKFPLWKDVREYHGKILTKFCENKYQEKYGTDHSKWPTTPAKLMNGELPDLKGADRKAFQDDLKNMYRKDPLLSASVFDPSKYPKFEKGVNTFYKKHFWDKIQAGKIKDQETANMIFDIHVNNGQGGARFINQAAKELNIDVGDLPSNKFTLKHYELLNKYEELHDQTAIERTKYAAGIRKASLDNAHLASRSASFIKDANKRQLWEKWGKKEAIKKVKIFEEQQKLLRETKESQLHDTLQKMKESGYPDANQNLQNQQLLSGKELEKQQWATRAHHEGLKTRGEGYRNADHASVPVCTGADCSHTLQNISGGINKLMSNLKA